LAHASGVNPRGAWRNADDEDLTPILATARDLFYEVGFHGATVRDIASRVGVTVPALYYHHANKEAILTALLDRSIRSVTERCEQALAEAGDDPWSRFRNLIECLTLYMANHRKSAAMDAEIRALSPAARKLYSTQRRRVEQMLANTIKQGVAAGVFEVTSPPDTARALLGMIQAITVWFSPGRGQLTASELASRYVDIAGHTVGLHYRCADCRADGVINEGRLEVDGLGK
jgi:AcrR family transcriptional regulator